jgi:pimeloyl-ACP methyl ester carboxylesterase
MGGIANILGEFLEKLDLRDVTIVMSDWGGPQLLVSGKWDDRLARLVICNCEAFDNVPPPGAARSLPYIARIPGGITTALRRGARAPPARVRPGPRHGPRTCRRSRRRLRCTPRSLGSPRDKPQRALVEHARSGVSG